ncbi:hypothetical protein [Streptomyces sp. NPDC001594]|uniref:hypothetical protein n=1 Tax=Streptomyces sp. NPDC001594 TaxID=3364590 RepID=UPI0036CBE851
MSPTFHFPEDLITLQQTWQQTYADLAQTPPGTGTTPQRRRLISLSARLCTDPSWGGTVGWRADGVELRRAAHSHTRTEQQATA